MKRSIEFRAWDQEYKAWITNWWYYLHKDGLQKDDKNIILNEYVGLEDKNGKKIFEDDIVLVEEHYLGDIKAPRQLAIVDFSEAEFYLENLEDEPKWLESSIANHTLNGCLTVIGNKHENNINQLKKDYSIKS